MDFYEVLDQVADLRRRRRRVTYRALKLQFKLDDEALEVLKDELLKAQRLAVDKAGEVLVWIGDATTAPEPPPPASQAVQPPATTAVQLPEDYAPLTMAPEQQKQQTLHALLTIMLRIAAQQPVLFVMEDRHWVDPTTLEFLNLLVDQGPTARILALWTFLPSCRPWVSSCVAGP